MVTTELREQCQLIGLSLVHLMSTKCIVYVAAAAAAIARLSPNNLQTHCEGPANSPGSGVGAGPIGFNMTC